MITLISGNNSPNCYKHPPFGLQIQKRLDPKRAPLSPPLPPPPPPPPSQPPAVLKVTPLVTWRIRASTCPVPGPSKLLFNAPFYVLRRRLAERMANQAVHRARRNGVFRSIWNASELCGTTNGSQAVKALHEAANMRVDLRCQSQPNASGPCYIGRIGAQSIRD